MPPRRRIGLSSSRVRGVALAAVSMACLVPVEPAAAPAPPARQVPGSERAMSPLGRLPASWAGDLPGAGGPVRWHVDLLPMGRYQLRRIFPDRPSPNRFDAIGGYTLEGRRLTLLGGPDGPLHWALQDDGSLRQLDTAGRPIVSTHPDRLQRLDPPAPIEPRLVLSGLFTHLADAPRIVLCADGRALPVQMAGDYLALERAYTAARPAPGAPLWVQLDASIAPRPSMEAGQPPVQTLTVERFERIDPQGRCEGLRADRPLEGTEWRLFWVPGGVVSMSPDPRRVATLRVAGGRVSGSDGCNRIMGPARVGEGTLQIGPLAGTRMACVQGAGEADAFRAALSRVQRFAVRGETLELMDDSGAALLRLRAVE